MPPDRVRTLAAAVQRAVESEAYRSAMATGGFTPAYEDPAQLAQTLERDRRRLGALLNERGVRGLEAKQFGPMFFPGLLFIALALVSGALLPSASGFRAPLATSTPRRARRRRHACAARAAWRFVEPLVWIALYIAFAETLGSS